MLEAVTDTKLATTPGRRVVTRDRLPGYALCDDEECAGRNRPTGPSRPPSKELTHAHRPLPP